MIVWRKLLHLLPSRRRADEQDIRDELEALREIAPPGELGNLTLAAEDARAALQWTGVERLGQDVRHALRSMRRQKAFTALVVASLALGIGANTAIFSFMESILLRPLPVRDPDALVVMKWRAKGYTLARTISWSTGGSSFDPATGTLSSSFPYPALQVFEDASDVVASAFGYFRISRLAVAVHAASEPVKGVHVSGGYFAGLGVAPAAGRLIDHGDDRPDRAAVAVLSHRFSRRHFGRPEAAVGRVVRLNDRPFTVLGIAPVDFFGAEPGSIPDVFIPLRADAILSTSAAARPYSDPHFYWIEIMARLKPRVSLADAQAALAPRFHNFVAATATTDEERQDLPALSLEAGAAGLDSLRREYARPIYILMTLVGVILLIACANIASLLLSRATARRQEIAIRLGLGAGRGRIVRQLLTESVLLASIGGAVGTAVAWWGVRALTQLLANGRDNFTLHAGLNPTVLGVTLGLSVATGLLFGLAPALRATRVAVAPTLKAARIGEERAGRLGLSLGRTLILAQLVLSLVLLIAAGLFGRTLAKLHAIELGFDRDDVLLFSIRPSSVGYRGADLAAIFERVREELRRVPGVQSVSLSAAALPMGGGTMGPVGMIGVENPPAAPDGRAPRAVLAAVGPAFFTTMRIPVAGRDVTERDDRAAPPVVVVNRLVAQRFGVADPIGRVLTMGKRRFEIVGVADDAVAFSLKEQKRPVVYFPYLQVEPLLGQMTYQIRTAGHPLQFAGAVRRAVQQVDARLALYDVETQAARVDQAIGTEIMMARLCTAFAALALAIAGLGVYGTVAYNVARRTNEFGIRMTLGAQRLGIVWMVVGDVLGVTAAGLLLGVPLALAGSEYVRSLLYGIEPTDAAAIGGAAAALIVCAVTAGVVPAWRASRIDPLVAIRYE